MAAFQAPLTPAISGVMGKLWLERGGTYVAANIRGRLKLARAYTQVLASRRCQRLKVYDDFCQPPCI